MGAQGVANARAGQQVRGWPRGRPGLDQEIRGHNNQQQEQAMQPQMPFAQPPGLHEPAQVQFEQVEVQRNAVQLQLEQVEVQQEPVQLQPEQVDMHLERVEEQAEEVEVQNEQEEMQREQPQMQNVQPQMQHAQPQVQHAQPQVQYAQHLVQYAQPPAQYVQPLVQYAQPPAPYASVLMQQDPIQVQNDQLRAQNNLLQIQIRPRNDQSYTNPVTPPSGQNWQSAAPMAGNYNFWPGANYCNWQMPPNSAMGSYWGPTGVSNPTMMTGGPTMGSYWGPNGGSSPTMMPGGPTVQFPYSQVSSDRQTPASTATIMDVTPLDLTNAPESKPEKSYMDFKRVEKLIPTFDGTNIKPSEFISNCRRLHRRIKPSDQEDFAWLLQSRIVGKAKRHLDFPDDEISFERIVKSLERGYRSVANVEELIMELNVLNQGPEEKVIDFYYRTKDIRDDILDFAKQNLTGARAASTKERAHERSAYCFVRGLNESIGVKLNDTDNLEEALDKALKRERFITEKQRLDPHIRPLNRSDTTCKPQSNGPITVGRAQVYTTIETGQKRRLCFICDSSGHLRVTCPYKTLTQKYYCTQCKSNTHTVSRCYDLHGKEKVNAIKEQEKRAKIAQDEHHEDREKSKQNLNNRGAPGGSGNRSAPIVIPPQRSTESTITPA